MSQTQAYLRYRGTAATVQGRADLHDAFGLGFLNLEFARIDELSAYQFEACLLPNVRLSRGTNGESCASTYDRSRLDDDLALSWLVEGRGEIRQRSWSIGSDALVLFDCAEPVTGESKTFCNHRNVRINRLQLLALSPDAEDRLLKPISMSQPAFRLLQIYVEQLEWAQAGRSLAFDACVAEHIVDLVALSIGTRGERRELAARRGGRAGRMVAIKRWIRRNLQRPELSVDEVAGVSGVGPRAVQKLFELEDTTFSNYVFRERLALARSRLIDPEWASTAISEIAFACGFGDLSYFNRRFREAYGETPGHIRDQFSTDRVA